MTKITALEVNTLRKQTGAGMMDCKQALVEADGNAEKAVDLLRKKGQKVAAKRADRDASEGAVLAATNTNNTVGVIIALNCETDFVAKNQDFVALANDFLMLALNQIPDSLEELKKLDFEAGLTVKNKILEQTGVIGERLELSHYEAIRSETVASYVHGGNKLASIVGLNSNSSSNIQATAKEIAMQVAAMNPLAIDKDGVSQEVIQKELEVAKDLALKEGKPENMLNKIAQGRLNKFFKENTLLNQPFVRDTKKSVSQYLSDVEKDLTVISFKRVGLNI